MSTKEQEIGGPGMSVATRAEDDGQQAVTLTPAAVEAKKELDLLRIQGAAAVERSKLVRAVANMVDKMTWGSGNMVVKGWELSEGIVTAIARICVTYDADPALHVNILSGNLYLNAAYWTRELNQAIEDGIVRTWRQNNIGPRHEATLRAQAEGAYKDAEQFNDPDLKAQARNLLEQSRYAAAARSYHEIPDAVVKNPIAAIYETIVEFPTDRDAVREANYAPHKGDPAGEARPGETAKTRSLRRAAVKALPKLRSKEEEADRQGVASEWNIVVDEKKQAAATSRQLESGPQAVSSGGHPSAAPAEGAQQLPVEDATQQQAAPTEPEQPPAFDAQRARRGLFATLKAAGIAEKDRKKWAKDNKFPESTNDWTEADFKRADEVLAKPTRDSVMARIAARQIDLKDLSMRMIGQEKPEFLVHYKALEAALDKMDEEDKAEGGWGEA